METADQHTAHESIEHRQTEAFLIVICHEVPCFFINSGDVSTHSNTK